jgi:hypothetical protein
MPEKGLIHNAKMLITTKGDGSDCVRAMAQLSGIMVGFVMYYFAEITDFYFFKTCLTIQALLILLAVPIIKYKLYKWQNPVIDFICALILGFVPMGLIRWLFVW